VSHYRHIIWDWNGTLFDDLAVCVSIVNRMLAQRAMPGLTRDHYRDVFTFPVRDYYQAIGFDLIQESLERLSREFVTAYGSLWNECALYPQTRRVLEHVRNSGRRQSVLSALHRDTLINLVQSFDLSHFFEHLMGLDHIHADSKIEQGRRLLTLIRHEAAEVLLVGDTLHDVEVAEAIGTACVLVAHGHQSKARLQQANVSVVDSLQELIGIIGDIPPEA
jgi:phosphoglycolate phosphatase